MCSKMQILRFYLVEQTRCVMTGSDELLNRDRVRVSEKSVDICCIFLWWCKFSFRMRVLLQREIEIYSINKTVSLFHINRWTKICNIVKALVQNLLAFAKGVFAKCILRRHNNFTLVAALVLGRLLLRALRNCDKIMH